MSTTPKGGSDHEQMVKFAQCMRENGVDVPDPEPGGGIEITQRRVAGGDGDATAKKFEAAQAKCRSFMPNGGGRRSCHPPTWPGCGSSPSACATTA